MNQTPSGPPTPGIAIEITEHGHTRTVVYPADRLWTIGRAAECDIVLDQPRASRQHAELFGEGERFTLLDTGSGNGTLVNGQRIQRVSLVLGDEIAIGTAVLRFGEPRSATRARGASSGGTAGGTAAGVTAPLGSAPTPAPSPAAGSTPARVATSSGRSRRSLLRAVHGTLAVVLIGSLAFGVWWFLQQGDGPSPRAPWTTSDPASVPTGATHGAVPGSASDQPGAGSAGMPAWEDPQQATEALEVMRAELVQGGGGWALLERLEDLRRTHPGTRAAEQARQWSALLAGVRGGVQREARARAEGTLDEWISEERHGLARAGARLLETLAQDETERLYWRGRVADLEATARSRFRALERDLGELLAAGDPGGALRALVEAQARFGGLDFYAQELPRYVEAGLAGVTSPALPASGPELMALRSQAARAFEECRFTDLAPIHYRMLALPLTGDDRLVALEALVQAHALTRLFEEFLIAAAGKTVEVKLSDHYRGKVIRVTDREVEQELDVGGHTYREVIPWERLGPVKKFALFQAVALGNEALVGLVCFARAIGHEEGSQEVLVRLFKRNDAGRVLASALLSQERRQPVPEDGYVVHDGRLVTAAERDAAVELARDRKEEEQRAIAELKRLRRETSLAAALEWARELRRRGNFELAQHILAELVDRFGGTEGAATAQELLDDPVLAVAVLEHTGPSTNRLDVVFLENGRPVENDYQQAFLYRAEACKKLFLNEEPYREYRSYFNFDAVQLGSRDRGLDRVPGEVVKDTPLDGKVEWTVITVNAGKVRAILDRVFGAGHDGQAIVIGNDYADVATGGGGMACLSKASLVPVGHEFGHALGALLDEYDSSPGNNPERLVPKKREASVPTAPLPPNVMVGSDRADVLAQALWRRWIDAGEQRWWNRSRVEVFEGANHTPFQHWRAQMDCKMRNAGSHFCVVCMEVMVRQIYRFVRPIDGVDPPPGEIDLPPGGTMTFRVTPMKPATHYLDARWFLEDLGGAPPVPPGGAVPPEPEGLTGVLPRPVPQPGPHEPPRGKPYQRVYRGLSPEGRVLECAELRAADLAAGTYLLTVEIRDPTEWVLDDPEGLLRDTRTWHVQVRER